MINPNFQNKRTNEAYTYLDKLLESEHHQGTSMLCKALFGMLYLPHCSRRPTRTVQMPTKSNIQTKGHIPQPSNSDLRRIDLGMTHNPQDFCRSTPNLHFPHNRTTSTPHMNNHILRKHAHSCMNLQTARQTCNPRGSLHLGAAPRRHNFPERDLTKV